MHFRRILGFCFDWTGMSRQTDPKWARTGEGAWEEIAAAAVIVQNPMPRSSF